MVIVIGAYSVIGLIAIFVNKVVFRVLSIGLGLFTAPGVVAEALTSKALYLKYIRLKAYNLIGFPRNNKAVF